MTITNLSNRSFDLGNKSYGPGVLIKKHLFVLALLMLTSCATVGNRQLENPETAAKIKPGLTTKAEVRALAGEQSKTTFSDNGEETWDYVLSKSQIRGASFIPIVGLFAGGADVQTYTLTVRFRPDGIVKEVGSGKTVGGGGSFSDK